MSDLTDFKPKREILASGKIYPSSPGPGWQSRIQLSIAGFLLASIFGFASAFFSFLGLSHAANVSALTLTIFIGTLLTGVVYIAAAFFTVLRAYTVERMRFATSPEGFALMVPGYTLSTTWDNASAVVLRKVLWYPSFEILQLYQNPHIEGTFVGWLLWISISIESKRILPLGFFKQSWQGDLIEDFKRSAPQALSEYKVKTQLA